MSSRYAQESTYSDQDDDDAVVEVSEAVGVLWNDDRLTIFVTFFTKLLSLDVTSVELIGLARQCIDGLGLLLEVLGQGDSTPTHGVWVAIDMLIYLLSAGRLGGAGGGDKLPCIIQVNSFNSQGEVSDEVRTLLISISTSWFRFKSTRRRRLAPVTVHPDYLALRGFVIDFTRGLSERRVHIFEVRSLLELSNLGPVTPLHQSIDSWSARTLSCMRSEADGVGVAFENNKNVQFALPVEGRPQTGDLPKTHVIALLMALPEAPVLGALGVLGLALSIYGVVATSVAMEGWLVVLPLIGMAGVVIIAALWIRRVLTQRPSAQNDALDVGIYRLMSMLSLSIIELTSKSQLTSDRGDLSRHASSRLEKKFGSNNCASVLLNKSATLPGEGGRAEASPPVGDLHWPALALSPPDAADEVVTIRLDPAGTMVLPLSANLQCPILLDGYHVHQHIALFGVDLSGGGFGGSGSDSVFAGADTGGQFVSSLGRLDDADDRRFTLSLWNDAIARITGFSSSAIMFNPFADIIADEGSYGVLKRLILDMEVSAFQHAPFPMVQPFQISLLTATCERINLTVTAAPVTENTVVDGTNETSHRLRGVLFLGSLQGSDAIHQWRASYYANALRYLHAGEHLAVPEVVPKALATEGTNEDFFPPLSPLAGVGGLDDAGCTVFSPFALQMMQMATDHVAGGSDNGPLVFSQATRDRSWLLVKRSAVGGMLRGLLVGKRMDHMKSMPILVRSSLPLSMEVDVHAVVEILLLLLTPACDGVSSMVLSSFGRGLKGTATVAMSVRVEGVSGEAMRPLIQGGLASHAPEAALWEALVAAGAFLFHSEVGPDGGTVVLVVPCRPFTADGGHVSVEEPCMNLSAVGRASRDTALLQRSVDAPSTRFPPLTVLVANSNSVGRANLMRLLTEGHHAVFPMPGELFPKAAHWLRTCGRTFDVVVADTSALRGGTGGNPSGFTLDDVHALCLEFSATSFIIRRRGGGPPARSPGVTVDNATHGEGLGIGITGQPSERPLVPSNLHFVDISHTPMSQRQLVTFIEEVAMVAANSARKAQEIRDMLKGHVNSPWRRGERLGKGSFGDVYEAHMTLTGGVAAVKTIKVRRQEGDGGEDPLAAIASEINILVRLQHPNIVQYFYCEQEVSDDQGIQLHIFMELCRGGSLGSKIASGESRISAAYRSAPVITDGIDEFGGSFALTEIATMAVQIVDALAYLHSQHIVHRDIKPGNLLLSSGKVKMADFGTAAFVSQGKMLKETAGTFTYMAPEVYTGESYSYPCDIWSVGCVLLDMLGSPMRKALTEGMVGATIFSGYFGDCEDDAVIHERIQQYILHVDLRNFLLRCLCVEPTRRATAAELQQHPFLTRHIQRQEALVRQSSMLRSASILDWRRQGGRPLFAQPSLDALSIASGSDGDEEEVLNGTVVGAAASQHDFVPIVISVADNVDVQQNGGHGVLPLTIEALNEASDDGSPMQTESPAISATPCNVWCTRGEGGASPRGPGRASLSTPHSANPHPSSSSAWNPLWGKQPLESPSRRHAVRRVTASAHGAVAKERPATSGGAQRPPPALGRVAASAVNLPPRREQ